MSDLAPRQIRSRADLIQYGRALDCVHCGLCLPACPTYDLLAREGTGPRGRVYLMRGLAEGEILPAATVLRDLDLCLVCRACEPVCPSGVRFGEMMEFCRAHILEPARPPGRGLRLRRFAARNIFNHPALLRALAAFFLLYDRLGLRRLLRTYGVLQYFSADLALRDAFLPRVPRWSERRRLPHRTPARGATRGRVALLEGCVAPFLLGRVNHATARVLSHQGFEVLVPRKHTCCGALSAHFGQLAAARAAALRTIDAFQALGPVDAVISNSAGCGAMMKDYGRLLEEAEGASAAEVRAAHGFAARVRDVTEFLVDQGIRPPPGRVEARVAYAAACHLAHAQRVTEAPLELLRAVPGLELVPLERADRCCGAGGLYNALHPRESLALLEARIQDLKRSGADTLATANPGCLLQWSAGIEREGLAVEVVHPVELFDRAMR
ncbi:MAG: (Fe-S)-binding protein [Planctomycetes bacterium]|nr:(Fe-S)-binding protein [Planctomycetota bacterium]